MPNFILFNTRTKSKLTILLLCLNSHDVIYGKKKKTLWKQKINEKCIKEILKGH